jgi:hypothetical protein
MFSIKKCKSVYYLYYSSYVIYKNTDKNTIAEVKERVESYVQRWGNDTLYESLAIVLEELGL